MRDWNQFFTFDEINALLVKSNTEIHETINAKILEALEAAPKVYGGENNMGSLSWSPSKMNDDTHVGRLIDVKPIDKGE